MAVGSPSFSARVQEVIAEEEEELKDTVRSQRIVYTVTVVLLVLLALGWDFFRWATSSRPFDVEGFFEMLGLAVFTVVYIPHLNAGAQWVKFSRARSIRMELMLAELLERTQKNNSIIFSNDAIV